jgi:hypothetical protein
MREGMNPDCRWPAESKRPLDLSSGPDQRHLRSDIEVAEELGVRYADHAADRQPISILGIQFRARLTAGGGILQRLRTECSGKLFGEIEEIHSVTTTDVRVAQAQLANKGADLPVNVPMVALFAIVATRCSRWIRERFGPEERIARLFAVLVMSLMVSAAINLIGQIWGGVVEMVRLGDEHLSYRAARLSWRQHIAGVFLIQIVAFWIVMAIEPKFPKRRTEPAALDGGG